MPRGKTTPDLNVPVRSMEHPLLRLKPLAQAIALLMIAGSADAATAFSSGWFAAKGAAQASGAARPGAQVPGAPPPLAQQQRVTQQLQRSLDNLNNTVAAIAAQQAAQAAGRQFALGQPQSIPNGLGEGGLKVDDNALTKGWINANGPQQTQVDGKTTVRIQQTADKAILNWETFNVGRDTTVEFAQQSNWAVLNRVNDPNARASVIAGQINAPGTVMLVNRNGILFSGGSQVNVRNLVAAAATISDDQFSKNGLYVDQNGTQPTFSDAFGKVEVQRGAVLQTLPAGASTQSGGYALLLGNEVQNDGSIVTPKGQATLAAGDSFYIRRGAGTEGNQQSTTRGNEVAASLNVGSSAGTVINSGMIQASTGDITLTGHQVRQNGVLLTSTSVDTRGTIHLLNATSDATGSVTLGQGSVSTILLEQDTSALDSQRQAAINNLNGLLPNNATGRFDNLSKVSDRTDQSRVEIVSGGTVDFQSGSIILATGGQVAVSAGKRSLVREGAIIDVAGAVGVKVAMEANSIKVNIQGNEQRDASGNRDKGSLNSTDVWVDVRDLVHVAAGVNGYATDRWYTAGGLLEVGGYLGTRNHSLGEWMAQGGSLTFTGNDLVTRQGSQINLSGGTLDVQSGYVQQSWLKGADGRLYEVSKAPGDLLYTGVYKGYENHSERWGQTDYFYNPLIAPRQRYEEGYSVGRDAGQLVVATNNAVLEGELLGKTFQGDRQTQAPQAGLDGYQQTQSSVARGAQLIIGSYVPRYLPGAGGLTQQLGAVLDQVTLSEAPIAASETISLDDAVAGERKGNLSLNSRLLNDFELGAIRIAARDRIVVDGALQVSPGGDITLYGPHIDVNADLTAHSGSLRVGNVLNQLNDSKVEDTLIAAPSGTPAKVVVAQGVTLDASGLWRDQSRNAVDSDGVAWRSGGTVSLRSSDDLNVQQGSRIDVSSGATLLSNNTLLGGRGGDVTLAANATAGSAPDSTDAVGQLLLGAELAGYGVEGAGLLDIQAGKVQIGNPTGTLEDGTLVLAADFFNKGFGQYKVTGNRGLTVLADTQVDVTRPVYRLRPDLRGRAGTSAQQLLEVWTPGLYQQDAIKGVLTQRGGAGLSLNAGTRLSALTERPDVSLIVEDGAVLNVDPGQAINLGSIGQLTVNGQLNAWGGAVSLSQINPVIIETGLDEAAHQRSIRLGSSGLIDVSARAVTAIDAQGRRYGTAGSGGSIIIGSEINADQGSATAPDLFVVLEQGSRLLANGAQAELDIRDQGARLMAGAGGKIALSSNNGLLIDGQLSATAGGAGAAGGSLSVALESGLYLNRSIDSAVRSPRELILSQGPGVVADPSAPLAYGQGRLDVQRIVAGGFDNLSLLSNGILAFDGDVNLSLKQSLSLYAGSLALSENAADTSRVSLHAPYLRLAGATASSTDIATRPTVKGGLSTRDSAAQLLLSADLLDVRDQVTFGAHGSLKQNQGPDLLVDRRGFAQTRLRSSGDLRFLGASAANAGGETVLQSNADLNLLAAQLYPVTGARAKVLTTTQSTLSIGRTTDTAPAVPYSAFGQLTLDGGVIEQGGWIRAPFGLLSFGLEQDVLQKLSFLPGSLTSVSGEGLRMPYGGTVDGLAYQYNGKTVELLGAGGSVGKSVLSVGIAIKSPRVDVQPDAVLDLSGGGELSGAGFIAGRGGSTDARYNPLVQNGADGRFTLPGLSTNPVYAIVPGSASAYAPLAGESGVRDPAIGQRITLDAGVPGLPAGTYTLMPASYAFLPGAFRVELNGLARAGTLSKSLAMRNGSWATSGRLSIANTGISDPLSSQLIVTSGDVLRRYSQYNETGYATFAKADAALKGVPRPMIEADGKTLLLNFTGTGNPEHTFSFKGQAAFTPASEGLGGSVGVIGGSALEVLAAGQSATPGLTGPSVYDSDLNALKAPRLSLGALPGVLYGQGGNLVTFDAQVRDVYVRQGATLRAGEVFLVANGKNSDGIVIEQGASLNTLGQGKAPYDSRSGFIFDPGQNGLLAVSNGWLDVLPPTASAAGVSGASPVRIGLCNALACTGTTELYSEGSITVATDNTFSLDDSVRFGTRNLILAVGGVNIGSAQALAAAQQRNALPQGLTLNQPVLDRLLRGDPAKGAPALENLVLNARDSVNFYGSAELSTLDSNGQSRLQRLVLGTPAIYGYGAASDRATIRTGTLVWNGTSTPAAAPIANGAGTGSGLLDIAVDTLEFGYGPQSQASNNDSQRLALGFNQVSLTASQRITANHTGGLRVYQAQGDYVAGSGFTYSGGDLRVSTPLWTGEAGSINRIKAGGAITVSGMAGLSAGVVDASALGAELALEGRNVLLDSTVRLPSGKLSLTATGDLTLGDAGLIDLAGRELLLNDVRKYSWGGDLILKSQTGSIRQAGGSLIDVSARNNHAGSLSAYALDETAGLVDLQGQILGSASGDYNAGGTQVPYAAGGVDIRAQSVGDFAALNQRLNRDHVFGSRSFQLKRGDLVIGNELKANQINVSVDNGSLTVLGTVDASGRQVGSIRLAGNTGLTLASTALLDAHGAQLRVDSYGKIIDAPNRAVIELTAGDGTLVLAQGSRIDLRHGTDAPTGNAAGQNDGRQRGTLELNTRRLGADDIDIDARGPLAIQGARSITLNAVQRYTDAPTGSGNNAEGRPYQVIDQAYLDGKHTESVAFIDAALANTALLNGKLAGLNNGTYADAFHLRPGVQIASATVNGDMVISGDVDLSGYRYASLNPHSQKTSVYGSGEPGSLVIRAGGNLDIFGSVTDGFMPPDPSDAVGRTDGNGWLLIPGKQPFGADVVVPRGGVELADGTQYPAGSVLNYDVPFKAMTLNAGTLLPNALVLDTPLNLAAGTLLSAAVRDVNGDVLFAAGTLLKDAVTLPSGSRLDAGSRFNVAVAVQAGVWPKGVALPDTGLVQSGVNALPIGGLIPAETDVKLAEGTDLIELRPSVNGQQGRNWAVATLLPDGSLSWSMRLVAGADTEAADTRLTRVEGSEGHLRLADGHYMAKRETTGEDPGTGWLWSDENGVADPGTPVPEDQLMLCDLFPNWCVKAPVKTVWMWSPDNPIADPGTPVPEDQIQFCSLFPSWCVEVPAPQEPVRTVVTPSTQLFSVLRTGTGDLDLLSAGDFSLQSLFGVYTAGTQSASLASDSSDPWQQARGRGSDGTVLGTDASAYEALTQGAAYQAWYPEQGGNLRLNAGGQLRGDTLGHKADPNGVRAQVGSAAVGNWLWRQGMGNGSDIPTAWWINFGTFVGQPTGDPALVGFTGIGTLGGGNLQVSAAGDAGLLGYSGATGDATVQRSQGINLAVGSSGRVASDGSLVLTGGGDLQVHIGGQLNASATARAAANGSTADLKGTLVNLRGSLQLQAGAIGALDLSYGSYSAYQDPKESRAYDAYVATLAKAQGGVTVVAGDAGVQLNSRGDLVLDGVGDPGRLEMKNATGFKDASGTDHDGFGYSGFSLWTPNTAIDLFSAGGNLTPFLNTENKPSLNTPAVGGRMFYPSILRAVAANGSLYYGASASGRSGESSTYSLITAPSANAELQLMAGDSIYAGGYAVTQSGADPARIPTPFNPAFAGTNQYGAILYSNLSADIYKEANKFSLFTFGADGFSTMAWPERQPVRFYALDGDIVGLRTGEILRYGNAGNEVRYEGSGPLRVMAGRDIVNAGVPLGTTTFVPTEVNGTAGGLSTGNLIIHSRADDISVVSAGRDIRLSTFNVAGPGLLEVTAGRNLYGAGSGVGQVYQEGGFTSIGNVDSRASVNDAGASISLIVGAGAQGPNYQGLLNRYLGPGAIKNYSNDLNQWLRERFGFNGDEQQAAAYFAGLPAEQQRVFARKIYFAELKAGGREYNTVGAPRSGSYVRGREAIAALFPTKDVAGNTINYNGDVTLYGGAGIHTDFGGDIQVLTPGGRQVYGIEGAAPPSTAGVITQGSGDIQLYSQGSILLGQSRIMTTFGGSIFGWSAQGDINAGRGSKTTVVYTPPKRVYDTWGNVSLSPSVPSTGAGIATLNPIAEVAPGDIDLIAPLGTIDAGEAGIRVSGNVNIAALTVVNAANIQTQGKSSGVPVTASVNTGAMTSASSAATSATQAAEDVARQQQATARQNQASVFTVQVLSFGSEQLAPSRDGASLAPTKGYNPDSPVQVLGAGALDERARQQLTEEERSQLTL